jgi:hypothetical protein
MPNPARLGALLILAGLQVPAASAQDAPSPTDLVVSCWATQSAAALAASDPRERLLAERRRDTLEGMLPAVAEAAGTDVAAARRALDAAKDRVATRSLTLDPPGSPTAAAPVGCDGLSDAPGAYLAAIRR